MAMFGQGSDRIGDFRRLTGRLAGLVPPGGTPATPLRVSPTVGAMRGPAPGSIQRPGMMRATAVPGRAVEQAAGTATIARPAARPAVVGQGGAEVARGAPAWQTGGIVAQRPAGLQDQLLAAMNRWRSGAGAAASQRVQPPQNDWIARFRARFGR